MNNEKHYRALETMYLAAPIKIVSRIDFVGEVKSKPVYSIEKETGVAEHAQTRKKC